MQATVIEARVAPLGSPSRTLLAIAAQLAAGKPTHVGTIPGGFRHPIEGDVDLLVMYRAL